MLKKFRKRLTIDADEQRAEDLRAWVSTLHDVTPIAHVIPREVVRVAGAVVSIKVRPREDVSVIEAVIDDGTGRVTASWLGRRSIAGLHLGSRLIVEGRLGLKDGALQVMNPTFEFAAHLDA